MEQTKQHFLLVTYPAQGHINPVLHLASRLAAANGAAVTFSTAVSAHRRMFPSLAAPDDEVQDGPVAHIPFSDGFDEGGFVWGTHDIHHYVSRLKSLGSTSVSSILQRLRARGRPVDCVVYTFFLPWAADVARANGVPSAHYWIQPATVFAIYYHYFHGYSSLITTTACNSEDPKSTIDLPGLPPLRSRDLPSFLAIPPDNPYSVVLDMLKDTFETLERERALSSSKPMVLMNTFAELEEDALSAVEDLALIPIGPILSSSDAAGGGRDLFKLDEKGYMEWLDSKPRGSVVYVSFGSMAVLKKEQTEEILEGLRGSGQPWLWVLRRDCRWEGLELLEDGDESGVAVEWCSQVEVLSHPSVGCFVTHCGWNSTVESLVCGVPTVGVPQWTDQGTNAMLAEKCWGTGVRGEVNGERVLGREELKRCLDLIMGEGESSVRIRKNVELWRDKAREAISAGGSSYQNLRKFVDGITKI